MMFVKRGKTKSRLDVNETAFGLIEKVIINFCFQSSGLVRFLPYR